MIISPPFLPVAGATSSDPAVTDPMMDAVDQFELTHHGLYPIAFDRRWHGGVHLVPNELYEPVRAIADGEVVAFLVSQKAISDGQSDGQSNPVLNCNNGFVLLKHTTDTGDGRTIAFYSLYMHLLDIGTLAQDCPRTTEPPANSSPTELAKWLETDTGGVQAGHGKKVYRKDILGYMGGNHGYQHLHFEIFMTDEDFNTWFAKTKLGEQHPAQPTSSDYWGHTYFVIPGGTTLLAAPPGHTESPYFPSQPGGTLDETSTLYVEAWFHKGQRYMRAWLNTNGKGKLTLLTPEAIQDPYKDYDYKLYQRATDLYPACPSDGYELMRFGRILSQHPTLPEASRQTYVAVPFDATGKMGYVDVNQSAIVKLSDADFPFFMGWRKVEDANAPVGQGGLWEMERLRKLVGDSTANLYLGNHDGVPFSTNEELAAYVQGSDEVRARLKGFVCHATSEWDPANNDQRYSGLNEPDGYFGSRADTDPDGYRKFLGFLKKFQFLDQTPLGGGKKLWHFHPLAFIRHFRKCGWLSQAELQHLLPRNCVQKATPWKWQKVSLHGAAPLLSENNPTAIQRRLELNNAIRKYGIQSPVRMACFFGNATEETQWFQKYHEGSPYWYKPWDGRGMLQLTHATNYITYWAFRGFLVAEPVKTTLAQHTQLANSHRPLQNGHKSMFDPTHSLSDASTHIPLEIINRRDATANPFEAADSAGVYWVWSRAAGCADEYWEQRNSTLRSLTTDHGIKYYYENRAFGKVAGTINTGSPSSQYSTIWDIQSRFMAFANAQVILLDITSFPQPNGSTCSLPVDFERVEAP
jgi:hypothetical protein